MLRVSKLSDFRVTHWLCHLRGNRAHVESPCCLTSVDCRLSKWSKRDNSEKATKLSSHVIRMTAVRIRIHPQPSTRSINNCSLLCAEMKVKWRHPRDVHPQIIFIYILPTPHLRICDGSAKFKAIQSLRLIASRSWGQGFSLAFIVWVFKSFSKISAETQISVCVWPRGNSEQTTTIRFKGAVGYCIHEMDKCD